MFQMWLVQWVTVKFRFVRIGNWQISNTVECCINQNTIHHYTESNHGFNFFSCIFKWKPKKNPLIKFENVFASSVLFFFFPFFFFRENVLSNLSDKAFDRPICEALLNQKYFNGIGNYLRAEILYRLFLALLLCTDSKKFSQFRLNIACLHCALSPWLSELWVN